MEYVPAENYHLLGNFPLEESKPILRVWGIAGHLFQIHWIAGLMADLFDCVFQNVDAVQRNGPYLRYSQLTHPC